MGGSLASVFRSLFSREIERGVKYLSRDPGIRRFFVVVGGEVEVITPAASIGGGVGAAFCDGGFGWCGLNARGRKCNSHEEGG